MSHSDKRSVSTDALETLGTIIDDKQKRDAIHLAVLPAIAASKMKPGQRVELNNGIASKSLTGIGIVDPFLDGPVEKGQRFWLVIKPRVITSLRHVWTHPSIPDDDSSEPVKHQYDETVAALEKIANEVDCPFDLLIEGAKRHIEYGDYLSQGGRWEGTYLPDEFWTLFENYTGISVDEDKRYSFFSCSC